MNNKDRKLSCFTKIICLSTLRAKNQRNLSEDTKFAFLKGKFLDRYIGVTDFFWGSVHIHYGSEAVSG